MASIKRTLLPWGTYGAVRDQLGSVRRIYLGSTRLDRHDDFAKHDELVLLIHGFFQTRMIWEVMEDRLRYDGYGVMSFNLGGLFWRYNTHPVEKSAALIAEKIERLAQKHGFSKVHVIGHSKGGLIARHWVQHLGGASRVRSLITLGTPHHGTPTAALGLALMGMGVLPTSARSLLPRSPLVTRLARDAFPTDVPLTSIYSRADLVCPWWASVLRPKPGETHLKNVSLGDVGHSELCWSPHVYRHVRAHLEATRQSAAAAS